MKFVVILIVAVRIYIYIAIAINSIYIARLIFKLASYIAIVGNYSYLNGFLDMHVRIQSLRIVIASYTWIHQLATYS